MRGGRLEVPARPIIPFIEGDGTGPDIWRASQYVFDQAVERAYGGRRRIAWLEVLAGEKAKDRTSSWLPDETLAAISRYLVAIKGPLTTPVGGGFRSLNVALRQKLDLYACVRPVRYFAGVPSPGKGAPGRKHGDLSGEHRRHLRRDRVQVRDRRCPPGHRFPPGTDGRPDHPVSRHQRHRDQADLGGRLQAADPFGHRLRPGPEVRRA